MLNECHAYAYTYVDETEPVSNQWHHAYVSMFAYVAVCMCVMKRENDTINERSNEMK